MMKKGRNFIKWLLCLLFALFAIGTSFFTHSTVIDGVVYTHSHPFNPNKTHEHCAGSLMLLEQFYQTAATSEIIPAIDFADKSSAFVLCYFSLCEIFHSMGAADNTQLRAPPICITG